MHNFINYYRFALVASVACLISGCNDRFPRPFEPTTPHNGQSATVVEKVLAGPAFSVHAPDNLLTRSATVD